jgi:Tol biopolymer transport system component
LLNHHLLEWNSFIVNLFDVMFNGSACRKGSTMPISVLRFLLATFVITISAASTSATPPAPSNLVTLGSNKLVFDSNRNGNHEIFIMNVDGSEVKRLTFDRKYENWWPRISPDRSKILFYRAPKHKSESYPDASLWVMNADGSKLTLLRAKHADGWTMQGHGEWSPDGSKIAMFGSAGASLQIFVTDAQGKNPVQFTNRKGVNTDVSWSPDGSKLLFNGCPGDPCKPVDYEIYLMAAKPLAVPIRLTNNAVADYDPYFSPDGKTIAWLVNVDPNALPIPGTALGRWAIYKANADGSDARALIDDGQINSKPAWSLDGKTIFFHRMMPPDYRFRVFRISVDGTKLTELTVGDRATSEFPSN